MRSVLACLLVISLAATSTAQEIDRSVQDVLFKITASVRQPDFFEPWKKSSPSDISGTGFLIEGNRILTNAHMVRHASQIYVQAEKSDQQYPAIVEFISPDVDLAILKLEDEAPLKDRRPIPFDEGMPVVRAEVIVYGYPLGGNQLSVTKGIVSRVEYERSNLYTYGLRTQVDAAVNHGNSGGPVFSGGRIVGVVFSGRDDADNIGYIIPTDEVKMFLQDVADGKADGRSNLWVDFGTAENPALRKRLKMPEAMGGIRISKISSLDPEYPLHVDDVIIKIGPHPIDSHGDVTLPVGLTLSFQYYIPKVAADNKVPLTIWRDGQEIEIAAPISKHPPLLITPLDDEYPSYAIIGPLAFESLKSEVSMMFASSKEWGRALQWRGSPIASDIRRPPQYPGQELVVVTTTFPSRLMKGYSHLRFETVAKVNGTQIQNLKHLIEVLRDCKDEYLQFSFVERDTEDLTFNRKEFIDATDDILTDNNIRKQFSDDLENVWDKP